jgi:hypothetical protein
MTNTQSQEVASGSMWRDFADYFTVPGLWSGLDRLLAHALGLRLLPPTSATTAAGSVGDGSLPKNGEEAELGEGWEAGVWHLQLWDTNPPNSDSSSNGNGSPTATAPATDPTRSSIFSSGSGSSNDSGTTTSRPSSWRLLGDVFIQVAPPGGFPFTSLLRPTIRGSVWWGTEQQQGGNSSTTTADVPGAVVIRLPLSLSFSPEDGSSTATSSSNATDPAPPGRPPALTSPFGLRALLHEAGHAVALLAAGAAAPHPLLSGAAAAGGGGGSIDLRELPSHLFEGWARDPRALSLASYHWRLGAPLPPKDAGRLARYAFSAAACSSLDLHEATLLALADARLHSVDLAAVDVAAAEAAVSATATEEDMTASEASSPQTAAEEVFDCVWAEHGVLPGGGTCLEVLRGMEAMGAIGGGKWGYAVARLLAAAVWKRWLGADSLCPAGGRQVKARLLYRMGAGLTPQGLVAGMLGDDALTRMEVGGGGGGEGGDAALASSSPDGSISSSSNDSSGSDGHRSPTPKTCWLPDLYSPAFQDVDLLA